MDEKSATKIINELESDFGVDQLEYKGYYVWPILKYYFFHKLLSFSEEVNVGEQKERTNVEVNNQDKKVWSLAKKVRFYLISVFLLLKNFVTYKIQMFLFRIKTKRVQYLCLDAPNSLYTDVVDGKKYSRFISPYIDFFRKKGSIILLNTFELKNEIEPRAFTPAFLHSKYYLAYQKYLDLFRGKIKTPFVAEVEGFDLFLAHIENEPYKSIISEKYIIYLLEEIILFERFWTRVLNVVKPRVVFLQDYCGNLSNYGLFSAAKKKSIITIDVQHGVSLAINYLNWYKVPKSGYGFLPKYYWCWSESDVQNVLNTRKNSNELMPVLGGNLWFSKNINERVENENNVLLEKILTDKKQKKVVLVSLQHSIPISEILIKAIQESENDVFWLIRFHPGDYMDPEYRPTYIKHIKNLKNVEYLLSTKANLYDLINLVNLHMTDHSTVAVEAISFGVPTVLLRDEFADLYKEYIDAGHFYVAKSCQEILNYIKCNLQINEKKRTCFQMQAGEDVASDLIKMLQVKS